ncbi:hypothetical protein HMPREF9450_01064 [Alistipes indistinctus YIT 12060]|uniref:Uncharacterized protein n=1 Tax=Alistipes indistinctus YIT 12060 TaxID=742725 RepID=G5H7M1_9BACT|nr:hypothetical protein HMPREF9450_01064 [Alistipes indistinctus YIT 12060]DAD61437.1 MAG TPA: hypothetical protein [Caudoviricetes sp.]
MNLNFTSKDKQKNSNYPNFLNNFNNSLTLPIPATSKNYGTTV